MKKLRIFCDFDGTIAQNDVGNVLITTFGDADHWWDLVDKWKREELDGRDLWRKQFAITPITPTQMDEFAATQKIDPNFPVFVQFCRDNHIPVYVVSDGMDAYIKRILKNNGLGDLEVRANHLEMHDDGTLFVEYPWYKEGCCNCGNCKGTHVRQETKDDELSVYIGDGHSDVCGMREADITFAKDALAELCEQTGKPYRPFKNFADVLEGIRELL